MKILPVTLLLLSAFSRAGAAQEPNALLLWPNGAPGSEGKTAVERVRLTDQGEHIVSSVHHPSITPYLPAAAQATGTAVIVIPGGGHRELWMDHEGYRVARWLSDHGIAAFVLKYRLAREEGSTYTEAGDELADVRQAIRVVRSRAAEWHIDPDRVGVIGFSAGGELAALAGMRIDRDAGAKPSFMGLVYPAIPDSLVLSKDTPPAFLLCGADDAPAIAEGLPELYRSIRRAGGSAELHILAGVGHGFGMRESNPPAVAIWPSLFYDWLAARGLLGALGSAVSLTPNAPWAANGAHLSFWKPSFVLGTSSGGEAGFNFWGLHNQGHVNVGFTAAPGTSYLLDCRLRSDGVITYKIYDGAAEALRRQAEEPLAQNHVMVLVAATKDGGVTSVELWPTPVTELMSFLGCDLSIVTGP